MPIVYTEGGFHIKIQIENYETRHYVNTLYVSLYIKITIKS